MKAPLCTVIFSIGALILATAVSLAETFQLTDGSVVEGTLAAPADVIIKTAAGDKRVPYALLSPAVQKTYWKQPESGVQSAALPTAPVADEELEALANDVNLEAWMQIAAIGSFRDKPEKRGTGGLVVTKAFNALDENWVSVYSPKDPVGTAGNWDTSLGEARILQSRSRQFIQKRWLELFVKAAEAVGRRDSAEFAIAVREMKRSNASTAQVGGANGRKRNFFTAK